MNRLIVTLLSVAATFGPSPTPVHAEERTYAPAELRADFDALERGLASAQFDLHAHVSRAELAKAAEATRAALDRPMTKLEAQRLFQRYVAKLRIAHARIPFPGDAYEAFLAAGGRSLPLDVRIDAGRLYVVANRSDARIALGAEITAIDGEPVRAWLERLGAHVSADTPYLAHSIVDYRFAPLLWLEQGEVDAYTLTIDGEDVRVATRTQAEQAAAPRPAKPLLALDDARIARMIDDVAYLRPGPFYNTDPNANPWDASGFASFVDDAFAKFLAADAKALLIDLRNNPGGDAVFSDKLVAWIADEPFRFVSAFRIRVSPETTASNAKRIEAAKAAGVADAISPQFAALYAKAKPGDVVDFPVPLVPPRDGERFDGDVYVLVDRATYSNAVNVAAIVQDYGFGRVLGEETTDFATTYGAMEQFTLPNTGLPVGYAKAHLIRPSGDRTERGVVPDVPIATPVIQYEDVVLSRALAIVKREAANGDASATKREPRERDAGTTRE